MRIGFVQVIAIFGAVLAYLYHDAVTNGVKVTVVRQMACSKEHAFKAVTDFNVMPQISSDILRYDFDDGGDPRPMHLNMKFSETRRMGKDNELVTNLEVREFDSDNSEPHARMVADTHGTIWDTTFDVRPAAVKDGVILEIAMHAKAHEMVPKLLNPIMQILFRFGLNKHIDQVKIWCEQQGQ